MQKKTVCIILLATCIALTGCGNKQVKEETTVSDTQADTEKTQDNSNLENGDATENNTTTVNDTTTNNSEKISYEEYSGTWVPEANLKMDYLYGLVVRLTIDKEGNLIGSVGNCAYNVIHIANVDVKGKIENDKFTYTFDEDAWGHKGTINIDFKGKQIIATIKYTENNESNEISKLWGVGEGTFTLIDNRTKIDRTLQDLVNGRLEVIGNQCFDIDLNSYGQVKFISGIKSIAGVKNLKFYLADKEDKIIYSFPDVNPDSPLVEMKAASFEDINNDGLKEIIIIADYLHSSGTKSYCSIYFPKDDGFINDKNVDDKINSYPENTTIQSVIACYKENFK